MKQNGCPTLKGRVVAQSYTSSGYRESWTGASVTHLPEEVGRTSPSWLSPYKVAGYLRPFRIFSSPCRNFSNCSSTDLKDPKRLVLVQILNHDRLLKNRFVNVRIKLRKKRVFN